MIRNKDMYIDQIIRIALIALIVIWTLQLLYPLLGIIAWGFVLAVIVYPFYDRLNRVIGNRPYIAATVITLCLLFLILGITVFVMNDIVLSLREFTTRIDVNEQLLPKPPESIQNWPLIGNQLHNVWSSASENLAQEISKYWSTIIATGKFALSKFLATSKDFLLFVIAIILSGFLLVHTESFISFIRKLAKRVADEQGNDIINIIKKTIQNVSRGIIGISLLQTFIFWIVLSIAGLPGVGLLSLLALILSIAQLGLFILVIPIIIWLFFTKSLTFALTISIFLIIDSLIDSLLKPIVMSRGLTTPMLIIFIGVIGGILVYGLIGVFVGPVVLALAYNLMSHWIEKEA